MAMRSRMIVLLELVERLLGVDARGGVVLGVLVGREALEDLGLDGLGRVLALELVVDARGLVDLLAELADDLLVQVLGDRDAARSRPWACRRPRAARAAAAHSFLIAPWAMSSASRISASGIWLAPASTMRMASSVPATTRSRSLVPSARRLLGRVDDEVALDLADAHRADRGRERDRRDHQRRGGAVHREDVVRVDVVHRKRDADELRLVAPVLREQRAQRPVDHARGERAPRCPSGPRA